MIFSKVQILQALQAKIDIQQIAPTNLVNPNPSVPPSVTSSSQQEDDEYQEAIQSCQVENRRQDEDSEIDMDNSKWDYIFAAHGIGIKQKCEPEPIIPCQGDQGTPFSLYPQQANIASKGPIAAANLVDNGTVMRAQIVPQEDSPIIYVGLCHSSMILDQSTDGTNERSKATTRSPSYSSHGNPLTRPSNASSHISREFWIPWFYRNHRGQFLSLLIIPNSPDSPEANCPRIGPIQSLCFHSKLININKTLPGDGSIDIERLWRH
eukprot:jgi/Psemu1/17436/gm1.17436_g